MEKDIIKKNILLINPLIVGHHLAYLDWIANSLLEFGAVVRVATLKSTISSPQFSQFKKKYPLIEVDLLSQEKDAWENETNCLSSFQRECYYYKLYFDYFSEISTSYQPDLIFIPYIDFCLNTIALFGSPFRGIPWGAITMRPSFHYRKMGVRGPVSFLNIVKRYLFRRLVIRNETLKCLFTIDESLMAYIKRYHPDCSKKVIYLPDPVKYSNKVTKGVSRQLLSLPKECKLILVYGQITSRKGIVPLVRSLQESGITGDIIVLLAGVQDDEIKEFLMEDDCKKLIEKGTIYQKNHYLTDEEEALVFSSADIVWLGYQNHFTMSGVIIKAAQFSIPVVSCDYGLLGWYTLKYSLGITVDIKNPQNVVMAFLKILNTNLFKDKCSEFVRGRTISEAMKVLNGFI